MLRLGTALFLLCSAGVLAHQDSSVGATVYEQHCASCHDATAVRVPPRSALQLRSADAIMKALDSGVMRQQGMTLSTPERIAVARWLGRKTALAVSSGQLLNSCKGITGTKSDKPQPAWTSWGGGLANLRFQAADSAGLTADDAQKLKLKWAFAVPDATYLRSQPAVYNGQIIFGGGETVYSLDATTGCTHWATAMPAPVRSGISIAAACLLWRSGRQRLRNQYRKWRSRLANAC